MYFSCLHLILALYISVYCFRLTIAGLTFKLSYGWWFHCGTGVVVSWSFIFDPLGCSTAFLVLFVSFLIHLYSIGYMVSDPHIIRFMSFLSLFTGFMIFLVLSSNLLQFFLAWEGIGICSYLLISFWYTRRMAVQSALEAVSFNRVGDMFFLVAICLLFIKFGSVDFREIFLGLVYLKKLDFLRFDGFGFFFDSQFFYLDIVNMLLFIGVMSKSAQLGLHVWLPDAMEGPTPVSALLHSSTMVVAGVFLLLRCAFLLEYSLSVQIIISFIGAATAFFAASIGLVQHDIKKIIAYSTCSQLGYMVFICGLSGYAMSFYHLFNHAFFKSLLFLASGVVIHALSDEQDIRRMGGLANLLPFTYAVMLIGSFSLSGMPFLSGFFSKDGIIEFGFSSYTTVGWFSSLLTSLSAFLTSLYSVRLLYLVFLASPRYARFNASYAHDASDLMAIPLFLLAFFSIFSGYLFSDLFVGVGTPYWASGRIAAPFVAFQFLDKSLCPGVFYYEFLPPYLKLFPVFFSLAGFLIGYVFYFYFYDYLYSRGRLVYAFDSLSFYFRLIYHFFSRKWYIDYLWFYISEFFLFCSHELVLVLEQGWFLNFGPSGVQQMALTLGRFFYFFQSGLIYHYLFIIVFSFVILFLLTFKFLLFKKLLFLTLFFGFYCFFLALNIEEDDRIEIYEDSILS